MTTGHSPFHAHAGDRWAYGAQQHFNACRVATRIVAAHSNTARGFTLLELLVVMVILGLLAAYVGPRYFAQVGKSEQGLAKAQIESFFKALDAYRLDVGAYPTTEEGLQALVRAPAAAVKWNGPYLQKGVPADPWGRPYIHRRIASQSLPALPVVQSLVGPAPEMAR